MSNSVLRRGHFVRDTVDGDIGVVMAVRKRYILVNRFVDNSFMVRECGYTRQAATERLERINKRAFAARRKWGSTQ